MIGRVRLRTARLALRDMTAADADFLVELVNEPGWIAHIGDRGIRDAADAQEKMIDAQREHRRRHGFALMTACIADDLAAPVGICGLLQRDWLDAPDLGFAFLARACGHGYATEAGAATLVHADADLGRVRVLAVTSERNAASRRVLAKLGFRPDGFVRPPNAAEPVRRHAWTSERRSGAPT